MLLTVRSDEGVPHFASLAKYALGIAFGPIADKPCPS
tara:strand:+ start:128 stop:238 length:111 start_codon:yes stop_codon:yes gene_type:complete